MTPEEIMQNAAGFSNFSGFAQDYTGYGDEFIDFAGSTTGDFSVLDERIFKISITAAASQTGRIYLTPGLLWAPGRLTYTYADNAITAVYPAGYVRDGAFKDTTGTYSFTGAGSPNYIEWFYAYIDRMPMTLHAMRISSGDATQIEQQIIVEPMNPFYTEQTKIFDPSAFNDENTYKDKVVTIPMTGVTIGPDIRIYTNQVANTTSVYTFFLGNALHTRKALEKKTGRAASTLLSKNVAPTSLKTIGNRSNRALRG